MDIVNQSLSSIKIDTTQTRISQLLQRLQQAGLFRALVIASEGKQVTLDTAFGRINGKVPQQLRQGDEILARLLPGDKQPTIKIEQHHPKLLTLDKRAFGELFTATATATANATANTKPNPSQAVPAKVISQTTSQTLLQIADKTYPLPRQNQLQAGDSLMLRPNAGNNVDLIRLPVQQILKNALTRLLPPNLGSSQPASLNTLPKLSNEILQLNPQTLYPGKQVRAALSDNLPPQKILYPLQADLPVAAAKSERNPQPLQQLLGQMARPLATLDSFKPVTMQQILVVLTLLKPAIQQQGLSTQQTYPELISAIRQLLIRAPDSLPQLVRSLIEASAAVKQKTPMEHLMLDSANQLRNELLQQLEQAQSQLMLQKTSLRLQLEQNQPLQFNLSLPLQVQDKTTTVKLRVQQRQRHEDPEQAHWEINLSFEFGLLGLITTHILLQGQKISAQFWAIKTTTKQLIDQQLDQFKTQLQNSGFETGLFNCYMGQPPASPDATPVPINDHLLDIEV